MKEKTEKRIVSQGRYAWLMAGRAMLFSVSIFCFLIAMLFTFTALFLLLDSPQYMGLVAMCALAVGFTLYLTYFFYKMVRNVERVAPITKRTTSSLSPEKSLLRSANLPAFKYQAELLRATGSGPETPPEELLRPINTKELERG